MNWQPNYDGNNHASNTAYDADGNTLNDGFHAYAWDAAGEMATVDSSQAVYDALGRRVEGAGAAWLYAPSGGNRLALMGGQSLNFAVVPLPSGFAVYNSAGLALYQHADWLGSSRVDSTPARTATSLTAYAPYGDPDNGMSDLGFTGKGMNLVNGATAGLYDFPFREYQPTAGRWLSPDPAGLAAVSPANPQSWNRYSYVENMPLAGIDALGLQGGNCGNPCNVTAPPPDPEAPFINPENPLYQLWWDSLPQLAEALGIGDFSKPPAAKPAAQPTSATTPQAPVNCNTVLPNGQTVGDVVRQEVTALRDAKGLGTAIDTLPILRLYFAFAYVARPGGPIDFKNNFKGRAAPNLLGQAGNFAYYAIGSAYFASFVLDGGVCNFGARFPFKSERAGGSKQWFGGKRMQMKNPLFCVVLLVQCAIISGCGKPQIARVESPNPDVFLTVETSDAVGPASSDFTRIYAHLEADGHTDKELVLDGEYLQNTKVIWLNSHEVAFCVSGGFTERFRNYVSLRAGSASFTIHAYLHQHCGAR